MHSGIVSNVNRYWYYFAVADDGREFPTWVKDPDVFDLCDGLATTALTQHGFRELDIGDSDNYTLTFIT